MMYLHEDGLRLSAMFPSSLFTMGRKENLIGRDASISHPFLSSQHPDDDVRHAVLRLQGKESISLSSGETKHCVCNTGTGFIRLYKIQS